MTRLGRNITAVVSLIVIVASIYGITHRQEILDYLALRNYTPAQRVVQMADDTTMRDETRRVFYINHPELNDKTQFRQNCPSTVHSIVLGCYIENRGIFLLDVTDQRLNGVIQVTAAHEVLHAEYDRLSSAERENVDKMTAAFFSQLSNERIKSTIERYRSKDSSTVPGELHSILGTEVRELSPELEAYYSQYFSDRSKIVSYSEGYEQTFVDLSDRVGEYDSRLELIKETIESNRVEIQGQGSEIERQKKRLDDLLAADQTEEYNASVESFNTAVNDYNRLLQRTKSLIAEYNEIVEQRNNIATTEKELEEAINSNIVPQEQ
jgi:uncharacterized protein YukE